MAKFIFPLGLITVLLSIIICTVLGDGSDDGEENVTLDQMFIVAGGSSHGGCDDYFDQISKEGILDVWLGEVNLALSTAIDSLDLYDSDGENYDPRVEKAVQTWFGIRSGKTTTQGRLQWISDRLKSVQEFFSFAKQEDENDPNYGQPFYPNDNRYLFCGSDFLVEQPSDTPAKDWEAKDIVDDKGDFVNVEAVPAYSDALAENADVAAWWSGQYTPINGYYFSDTGGRYCDTKGHLGLTAVLQEIEADNKGNPTVRRRVESVIICPYSFDTVENKKPISFQQGSEDIEDGTSLADVVPKSATLLHEAFHAIFGVVTNDDDDADLGFLEGNEHYDIVECLNAASKKSLAVARRNPENYVFFVTHMFYMLGTMDENIEHNWDFGVKGKGKNKVLGAKDQTR